VVQDIELSAFTGESDALKLAVQGLTKTVQESRGALNSYAKTLLEMAVAGIKAASWLVEFAKDMKESGMAAGLLHTAIVLLAGSIAKGLLTALVTMGQRLALSASIFAQLRNEIRTGVTSTEQAAAAQRRLDEARARGAITTRQYIILQRELNAQLVRLNGGLGNAAGAATGFRRALAGLGAGMSLLGGPIGVITLAVAGLYGWFQKWKSQMEETRRTLIEENAALLTSTKAMSDYIAQLKKLNEEKESGQIKDDEFLKKQEAIIKSAVESDSASLELKTKGAAATFDDIVKDQEKGLKKLEKDAFDTFQAIAESSDSAYKKIEKNVNSLNIQRQLMTTARGPIAIGRGIVGAARPIADAADIQNVDNLLMQEEKKLAEEAQKIGETLGKLLIEYRDILVDQVMNGIKDEKTAQEEFYKIAQELYAIASTREIEIPDIQKQAEFGVIEQIKALMDKAKVETNNGLNAINELLATKLPESFQLVQKLTDGLSGVKFFDAAKIAEDANAATAAIKNQTDEWYKIIDERVEQINKALSAMGPKLDPALRKKFLDELKDLNAERMRIEQNSSEQTIQILADAFGKREIMEAESVKGTELTEKEKIEAYKKGAKAYLKMLAEEETATRNTQIATLQMVKDGVSAKIKEFRALAIAATAAGNAELAAAMRSDLAKLGKEESEITAAIADLEEKNKKTEERLKREFDSIDRSAEGIGGGKGGGSKKEAKDETVELAKIQAERVKFEQEKMAKSLAENLKKGEVSVTDFIQKALQSRRAVYDAELQAAQASLAKARAGDSQAAIERAQLELDKLMASGADNTEEAYREAFETIEKAYDELVSKIQGQAEAIKVNVEMGVYSEAQGRDELKKIIGENQPALDALIRGMEEVQAAAQAAGLSMDFSGQIAQAKAGFEQLKAPLNEIANNINGMIRSSINGMLSDIAAGTMTLGEAVRQLLLNIAQGLAEIAAQQIASSIMGSIGGGPGGGIGGLISGIFGAFAEGGKVSGPGTPTSDSVLARLSAGEYVLSARAVRLWGTDFLDKMNRLSLNVDPRRLLPGFADGGGVGPAIASLVSSESLSERETKAPSVSITVRNDLDKERLIRTVIESPSFSKGVQKSNTREKKSLTAMLGN
jgi:hypothetical protein